MGRSSSINLSLLWNMGVCVEGSVIMELKKVLEGLRFREGFILP